MARRPTGKRTLNDDGSFRVRGKAGNGEGSVYFASDGRWRATYRVPGEARPRTASGRTREKAIAARDRKVTQLAESGTVPRGLSGSRTTIGELAEWWLHNVQKHQVRPTSWVQLEGRVRRIVSTIGPTKVGLLRAEQVIAWQGSLLEDLAPKTVRDLHQTLAQVVDHGVELGLAGRNVVRQVKAPRVQPSSARSLSVSEVQALVNAAREDRYGAAIGLLFIQGWRVSEALGLAWEDLDLDRGVAHVRRACIYVRHEGAQLGPTKSVGATGEHELAPTIVELLRKRRVDQAEEEAASSIDWPEHHYGGQVIHPVFTTPSGGLVLRQSVTKSLARSAAAAGIPTERLGTHTGRRSVVTALYADAGESIEEIARFIGHASPSTTAAYVRNLGDRPTAFARRAARLLDPAAADD